MATFGVWVEGSRPKSKSFYVGGLKIATWLFLEHGERGPGQMTGVILLGRGVGVVIYVALRG